MFDDNVAIKLFADDIKVYMEIDDISQAVKFQESINSVVDLTGLIGPWQLSKQVPAYACLTEKDHHPLNLSLCGNILPSVLECIDLGVYVDCALSFSNHISTL